MQIDIPKSCLKGEGGFLSWVPESIYSCKYTVDLRTWGNANFQNCCSSRGRLITLKTSWKKWLVFEVYIPAQYCWSNLTNQTWNTVHKKRKNNIFKGLKIIRNSTALRNDEQVILPTISIHYAVIRWWELSSSFIGWSAVLFLFPHDTVFSWSKFIGMSKH